MEGLPETFNKEFVWKFSATSHGMGVVAGVCGNMKSCVQQKTMSKEKDCIIVCNSASFAEAAAKLVPFYEDYAHSSFGNHGLFHI